MCNHPNTIEITVIISYYKNLPNLKLILLALNQQSNQNFDVIISEDDHTDMASFLANQRKINCFPILHINQKEDLGFRKNAMLNKAIKIAKGNTIVFIDGDCIPHQHFIKEYIKTAKENVFLYGRRVMLSKKISENILANKKLNQLCFTRLICSSSGFIKEGLYLPNLSLSFKTRGLLGCNWGIKKEYLLLVNGFDEDYVAAGVGEDNDIEWRLKAVGLKMKSVKNKAIVYHIYHPRTYAEEKVRQNFVLLHKKQQLNHVKCLNGLRKLT